MKIFRIAAIASVLAMSVSSVQADEQRLDDTELDRVTAGNLEGLLAGLRIGDVLAGIPNGETPSFSSVFQRLGQLRGFLGSIGLRPDDSSPPPDNGPPPPDGLPPVPGFPPFDLGGGGGNGDGGGLPLPPPPPPPPF